MIIRSLIYALCLAASLAGAFFVVKTSGGFRAFPAFPTAAQSVEIADQESFTDTDFRRSFLESINPGRRKNGYPEFTEDAVIEQWLGTGGAHLSCANLTETMASVSLPNFRVVRAAGATGGSLRELFVSHVEKLTGPGHAKDTRFGLLIRSLPEQQHEVIVVTAERLPDLTLASVGGSSTEAFVSQCAHCGKRSAFRNETSGSTLVVICPSCDLCTRLMGRDTQGRYHDAPSFLIPSPSPTTAPGTHPLDAMISIWKEAVRRCRYIEDDDGSGALTDSWQTPRQTLSRGTGDCEDSALLLTDWMLANRIPARMALGTMDGGGHAWCIVRVEGTDYLLESTNRDPDLENLPAVNPNDGYVPSALFDRDALYVRAQPAKDFNGDYWSATNWIRIPHRKAAPAKTESAPKTTVAWKP